MFTDDDTSVSTGDLKQSSEMTLGILQSTQQCTDKSEAKKNIATNLAHFLTKPTSSQSSANKQYAAVTSEALAAKVLALTKRSAAKFKKAPGAPKRFKTAFIFFSADKQKQIRAQMGNNAVVRTADISKVVSVAWKALLPDEKAKWEAMARKDKVRYEFEKSLYNGPWLVLNKRTPKDPNAPKRPMSAFLAFANSRRSTVKRQMPGCSNGELSRALAAHWKDAPEDVRQRYIEEECEKRKAYTEAMSKWRKKAEEEKRNERQEREEMALHLAEMVGANKTNEEDDDDDNDHGSLAEGSNYSNKEATALESFAPSTSNNALLNTQFNHLAYEDRGDEDNGTHQSLASLFYPTDDGRATTLESACFPSLDPHFHEYSHQVAHFFPSADDGHSPFDSSSTPPLNQFPGHPFISYPLTNQNSGCTSYPSGVARYPFEGRSIANSSSTLPLNQFPAQHYPASTAPLIPYPLTNQNEGYQASYYSGVARLPSADEGRLVSGASSTLPFNRFPEDHYLATTALSIPYPSANHNEGYASYPSGVARLPSADGHLTLPLNQFPAQDYLASTVPLIPHPTADHNEGHASYPSGAVDTDSAESQSKRR